MNTSLLWVMAFGLVCISGCATTPFNSGGDGQQVLNEQGTDSDGNLSPGMSIKQVRGLWGDTDCVHAEKRLGKGATILAYGLDPETGEVAGIPDCSNMRVLLYFNDGALLRWEEAE